MSQFRKTLALRVFGFTKIPMIFFTRPTIECLNSQRSEIRIRLNRRTQNHLKSMYFAVLMTGADVAAGLLAMEQISKSGRRISLIFKDVKANFLKRVDANAHFVCEDGDIIKKLIARVIESGERQHERICVNIVSPEKYGDEILAEVYLTLSLKEKLDQ